MPVGPLEDQPAADLAVWTTEAAVRAANAKVPVDHDLGPAIRYASSLLFRLSGRRYGTREVAARPGRGRGCGCGCTCGGWQLSSGWWAVSTSATWQGPPPCYGRCVDRCDGTMLRLPGPIRSVAEVVIDGEVLDPTAYRLASRQRLARTDGGAWPCYQDLSRPADPGVDRDGTWQVTYTRGRPIPEGGQLAASHLAAHVALAQVGSAACKLPQRVTQIVRQDVTMAFADPMDHLNDGRTGLGLVDDWLRSVNPHKLTRGARVYRADDPARR